MKKNKTLIYKELIDIQKVYYKSGATRGVNFRKEMLIRLKKSIIKHEALIVEALEKDLGKSVHESITTEIGFTISEINHAIKNLSKWDKKKRIKTNMLNMPSKSYIVNEPYGLTLIIGPWNYPFQLALSPLVGAIAGGNCAIVKPSEIAKHTSKIIKLVLGSAFSEDYISVVEGGIPESDALLEERFDLIFFTGSTQVGKIIMEKAAKHLTPVVLELGGKSPTIVDQTADLDMAARKIIFGKGTNAGQTCVAPDYVLVHEAVKYGFYEAFKRVSKEFYGTNILANSQYGRIINEKNYNRVKSYMNDGQIIFGGEVDDASLKIGLTLVEVDNWDALIMREEIFGPVLPVISYSENQEVFEIIERNPDPLALYMFSNDRAFVDKVVGRIHFGGGCINDTIMHLTNEHLPFGGRGLSGIGGYHGINSFKAFTHEKAILESVRAFELKLKYPPYNAKVLPYLKKYIFGY